jgi:hypothetical protein
MNLPSLSKKMPENKIFKLKDHNILPGPLILGRMELVNHISSLCDEMLQLKVSEVEAECEPS